MKRLLAAGYPRIFQICKCFRDGERGSCHLPEFTMLEWYCRDMDYRQLMKECEELIVSVAGDLGYGGVINYQGRAIGLQGPWESISVREAFACYAPMSMDKSVTENCFDEIMVSCIEPRLGLTQPTFIYDYPVFGSALAKQKKDDFALAERFELYMGGKEIANACSELTDPKEHHRRFENLNKYRHSIGKSIYPVSERFLQDIAAMPQAAGIALGVDRLAMIFCDSSAIDDVVSFVPEFL
jgi:lysyl-tRNA synthetase class 2